MRFRFNVESLSTLTMTVQRFVLAVLLSLVITFTLAAAYVFFPLIMMLARTWSGSAGTGGIAASAGGVSISTLLVTEVIVLAILFLTLSRRRTS